MNIEERNEDFLPTTSSNCERCEQSFSQAEINAANSTYRAEGWVDERASIKVRFSHESCPNKEGET